MSRLLCLMVLSPLFLVVTAPAQPGDDKMLTSPYFPLAVGTKWQYRIGETHYVVVVKAHEKVGGMTAAKLEMYPTTLDKYAEGKEKAASHEHVAVTGEGVVRVAFEGKLLDKPVLFLKLESVEGKLVPAGKSGGPWKIDSVLKDTDKNQTIKGQFKPNGDENVVVPAGTYKAATVVGQDLEVAGTKLQLTYHFAEKVGMVKQTMDLAGQKIEVQLEKYEAGK